MAVRLIPELPVLRRELIELANRKRTYLVRVVGAIVLLFMVFATYTVAVSQWLATSGTGSMGSRFFGIGDPVFRRIVPLLFYAVQLLLPALCCASITMEKERNTIGTLFLTRLSPWTIILEKMLSRIIPMLTILLLAAPVLAYVYSLGGVDTYLLLATFWLLFCECLLFASVAMLCSSYFSTTVSAFIGSYAMIAVLGLLSASLGFATFVPSVIWHRLAQDGIQQVMWQRTATFGAVPGTVPVPLSMLDTMRLLAVRSMILMWSSVPSLIVTGICLILARVFLIRRAFVSSSSALLRMFKVVDRFFTWLNDRTTGGIEIIPDASPLPVDDPVTWRERSKKSMGKARYLFRIMLCLEGPTLFICTTAASSSSRSAFEGLYYLEAIVWPLAVMITAVKAATLFSSERARQTIEPLLATPLSSRELLRQKIAGMKRLLIVVALPILTINLTHILLHTELSLSVLATPLTLLRPLVYFAFSGVVIWTLLSLTVWLCAGIGLRIHSQTKSVLVAVAVMTVWVLVAPGLVPLFPEFQDVLMLMSPASCVYFLEMLLLETRWLGQPDVYSVRTFSSGPAIIPLVICVLLYGGVTFFIRAFVQAGAPRLLNRLESPVSLVGVTPQVDTSTGSAVAVEG